MFMFGLGLLSLDILSISNSPDKTLPIINVLVRKSLRVAGDQVVEYARYC